MNMNQRKIWWSRRANNQKVATPARTVVHIEKNVLNPHECHGIGKVLVAKWFMINTSYRLQRVIFLSNICKHQKIYMVVYNFLETNYFVFSTIFFFCTCTCVCRAIAPTSSFLSATNSCNGCRVQRFTMLMTLQCFSFTLICYTYRFFKDLKVHKSEIIIASNANNIDL